MRYYPLFLDLHAIRCLIVGGGRVGCRKLRDVLCADPYEVRVLDVHPPSKELLESLHDPRVHFEQRPVCHSDFEGCGLVFAATSSQAANHLVTETCRQLGLLCNCIDAPDEGSFVVPARVSQGRLLMALSSGGNPALTKRIQKEAAQWLGERFEPLAELLARLRPLVLALNQETGHNSQLFRSLVCSMLDEALQQRDHARCETLLQTLLPLVLHPHIPELLHDLA